MKVLKLATLGLALLGTLVVFSGCRRYVYRTPRMVVETIRTPRCIGKRYTYFCKFRDGHQKVEIIRCRRGGGTVTDRKKWVVRDRRCRRHAFVDDQPNNPPPGDGPPPGNDNP